MTVSNLAADTYATFVEGEQVMIKSGGPVMTVVGTCDDCGEIDVAYGTSDGDIDIIGLPPEALVRVH
jgi:hypothetical protein